MAGDTHSDLREYVDTARRRGAGSLLLWGLMTAAAFATAFASWQFGPAGQSARSGDASLLTGSVPETAKGTAAKPAPLAIDYMNIQRELADLKKDIGELKRSVARLDVTSDQAARRLDALDDQALVLMRRVTQPPELPVIDTKAPPAVVPPPPPLPVQGPVAPISQAPPPQVVNHAALPPPAARSEAQNPAFDPRPLKIAAQPVPAAQAPKQPLDGAAARSSGDLAPGAIVAPPEKPAFTLSDSARAADPVKEAKPAISVAVKKIEPPAPVEPSPAVKPSGPQLAEKKPKADAAPPPPAKAAPAETTGSIPVKPATPVPAAPTDITKSDFAVDLGGFKTIDQLRAAWAATAAKHAVLTKPLQPLGQMRETAGGVEARLVAGPFANALDAAKFCAQVAPLGTTCQPSVYVGQPVLAKP